MTVDELIDILNILREDEDLWIEIEGDYKRLRDLSIDYFDKSGVWISDA